MSEVLVTGGAGFIGSNLCARLLRGGHTVRVLDNLTRTGAESNLAWLEQIGGARLHYIRGSVADNDLVRTAVRGVDRVYHLAGQVAVTSSVVDPAFDFEANAVGTFRLLEATRQLAPRAVFLYASTNKVYGSIESEPVEEQATRYAFRDLPHGIAETTPLDFHSPYGCSKGAGDQYVRDYARIYGVRTVVMRQSCIYGSRQFGHSDQGWLAWFVWRALEQQPIQICGDGKQVRDILAVDDLIDAYDAAVDRIDEVAGEVFNVGGGPERSISIWPELAPMLERLTGTRPQVTLTAWRPGDQRVFISDIRKAKQLLGWSPKIGIDDGLRELIGWLLTRTQVSASAGQQ